MSDKSVLQTVLEDLPHEVEVQSYSGRGMMGKQCLAVVLNRPLNLLPWLMEVAAHDLDDDQRDKLFRDLRWPEVDSMGFDKVVYWPRVEYVSGDTEREDEEAEENDL